MDAMCRLFLFIITLLMFTQGMAGVALPCAPLILKSQNKNIILPGIDRKSHNVIYLFQNKTAQGLWLDHPVAHPGASAGWASYVRAGNWSGLVLARQNMQITCSNMQPGQVNVVDCATSISVCVVKEGLLATRGKGSYWLFEDKSLGDIIKMFAKKVLAS
jgi:hypothetical protein